MNIDQPRARLLVFMERDKINMKALSLKIGRNPSFIQQYIKRRTPLHLTEIDRERLARVFGCGPDEFRSGDQPAPQWREPIYDDEKFDLARATAERALDGLGARAINRATLRIYEWMISREREGRPVAENDDLRWADIEEIIRLIWRNDVDT